MPLGYDTPVYEQGKNFSCGQRQRIAIARAILRDAPILILDEPTANLDVEAEAEVMHALSTLMANRTVLIVSHRLNILDPMDEILVLQEGKIAERGSLHELKQRNGIFTHMLTKQNRYDSIITDTKVTKTATRAKIRTEARTWTDSGKNNEGLSLPSPESS
jgi:ABC-type multidrug transport system fused ATPase/permease subunit